MPRRTQLPKAAARLRIAEMFVSQQGEGQLTGTRSFFIRTSGCNLRCWFCDTPYASWKPEGEQQTVDQIIAAAVRSQCRHVVLTGGEPLLPKPAVELVSRLRSESLHVTVETAGTIDREVTVDLMSISPKLLGSGPLEPTSPWARRHDERRWRPEVIRRLIEQAGDFQLKFVVDQPPDFDQAVEAVEALGVPALAVWIMPQAISEAALDQQGRWLRPLCEQRGYHYCDRMHIRWYGNRRGT